MICGNCGAHLPENADYCPNCGSVRRHVPREPEAGYAAGAPKRRPAPVYRTVSTWTYLLWWTIALFSNAEIVCFVLSIVFAFGPSQSSRSHFFRAVLIFKLIFLLIGVIAVVVLVLCGFSFTGLLNSFDFDVLGELVDALF